MLRSAAQEPLGDGCVGYWTYKAHNFDSRNYLETHPVSFKVIFIVPLGEISFAARVHRKTEYKKTTAMTHQQLQQGNGNSHQVHMYKSANVPRVLYAIKHSNST